MKQLIFILLGACILNNAYSQFWSITGNAGTTQTVNFIGTKDDNPLYFRIRNKFAGIIDSTNRKTFFGYTGTNASGSDNTAFGYKVLNANSTGTGNTGMGSSALNANTTGFWNTAFGWHSLSANTTGSQNTAFGMGTLGFYTGIANTTVGCQAMTYYLNCTGSYNVAVGVNNMVNNSTGSRNNSIGETGLSGSTTGNDNVCNGYRTLTGNITGSWNTAVGSEAVLFTTDGNYNTGVGGQAIGYPENSSYNTGLGYLAGYIYNIGYNNVCLGANTRINATGLYNCIAIGQATTCTASNQARIGNAATTSIGGYVGWSNISDGRYKRNVKENVKGMEFIMQLRPVTYQLDVENLSKVLGETVKDASSKQAIADKEKIIYTGFIAQEVEAAATKIGFDFSGIDKPKNDKDLYGLRYAEFVIPLVKGMQEHQQKMDKQKEQLSELDKEIELLKAQNELLKCITKADK